MRTLGLTIGNTTLACALFENGRLRSVLRQPVADIRAAEPLTLRLQRAIRGRVDRVALTSVVPTLTRPVLRQLEALTHAKPRVLTALSPHGLAIGYRRPRELGADRVAAALGARAQFPETDLIVVDCGTASTVTALSSTGRILGGAIIPGVGLWSEVLYQKTAQLPRVAARRPAKAIGRSPAEGIASGIHFGHAGALKELIRRIRIEAFGSADCRVIATGGNAERFLRDRLFDTVEPNLVLKGLAAFAQSA